MNKTMILSAFFSLAMLLSSSVAQAKKSVVDYVSTLVGTQSSYALSTGNTYPAIALPWGMNFWMPQTGKMGDGWAYTLQKRLEDLNKRTNQAHG